MDGAPGIGAVAVFAASPVLPDDGGRADDGQDAASVRCRTDGSGDSGRTRMPISRILIVKLSSLGDVVHSLPVAGALRRRFPRAEISWLVGPASAGAVRLCRHVDRTLQWIPGRRPRQALLADLRSVRPQLAFDLQGLARTAALSWLSGARWRVGFRSWQEGAFPACNLRAVPPRTDIHAVEAYLEFARYVDADGGAPDFGVSLPEAAEDYAAGVLGVAGAGPVVAIVPGTRWETKKWPAAHFAALAAGLADLGVRGVILGGADDRAAGELIAGAGGSIIRDLTGRTSIEQSAAVIARCSLVVGSDSGPIHLAAAMKVPVVALFGPTDPVRTGPYGTGHTVIQAPVPCLTCRRHTCETACMARIRPERVLEVIRARLGI
jgi:heptosyltransferase-1